MIRLLLRQQGRSLAVPMFERLGVDFDRLIQGHVHVTPRPVAKSSYSDSLRPLKSTWRERRAGGDGDCGSPALNTSASSPHMPQIQRAARLTEHPSVAGIRVL